MGFTEDIKRFVEKTKQKELTVLKNTCEEMATKIGERTGVDTGNLLGNYRIGINKEGARPNFKPGPSAWKDGIKNEAIAARNRKRALTFFFNNLKEKLSKLTVGSKFFLTTTEGYAHYVEYLGWEKTPPYRMFGRTVIDFKLIVLKIVKAIIDG